mmetsp:Transcript_43472/g.125657  ORF Transcript_43472/g.125657 Transcript_43472/m.125657 type:complete len:444 (+) Transcript_43472:139-1470(+)
MHVCKIDRGLLAAMFAVLSWLFVGTVFYWVVHNCSTVPRMNDDGEISDYELCPWHLSHAFYYSVQTGLSIGFGLLTESKHLSELYSCFHILAGSSFIGGALSFFVSLATTRHNHFLSRSERRLIKASLALHVDGYHGFTMPQIRELMIMHPQYANAIIRQLFPCSRESKERIEKFRNADTFGRIGQANDLLTQASEKLGFFQHDSLNLDDLVEIDTRHAGIFRKMRRFARENTTFIRITTAFVCWIAVGTIFSMTCDGNYFIRALYFAIGTLSTAGIVATNTVSSGAHVVFVGIYALIGIPLYGAMLGSFANILVQRTVARQTQEKLNENLSEAEAAFLKHLSEADGGSAVNRAEYTELQLLRLGLVDRETLNMIHARFKTMDEAGNGYVQMRDFLHAHHLEALDDGRGPSDDQVASANLLCEGAAQKGTNGDPAEDPSTADV